jgi:hypothetical protein
MNGPVKHAMRSALAETGSGRPNLDDGSVASASDMDEDASAMSGRAYQRKSPTAPASNPGADKEVEGAASLIALWSAGQPR